MHRTVAPKVEKCQVSTESVTTISGSAVVATRAEREREADPDASRPVLMLVLVAPTQFQISPTLPCQAEEARVHGVLAIKMARGSGSEVKLRQYHGLHGKVFLQDTGHLEVYSAGDHIFFASQPN